MTLSCLHRALLTASAILSHSLVAQTPAKKPERSGPSKVTGQVPAPQPAAPPGPSLEETKVFIKEKMEIWGYTTKAKFIKYDDSGPEWKEERTTSSTVEFFENKIKILLQSEIRMSVFGGRLPSNYQEKMIIVIDISELDMKEIKNNDNEKYLLIPISPGSSMRGEYRQISSSTMNDFDGSWRAIKDNHIALRWDYNDRAQINRLLNAFKRLVELHGGKPAPF